jgi:hypothetical protein
MKLGELHKPFSIELDVRPERLVWGSKAYLWLDFGALTGGTFISEKELDELIAELVEAKNGRTEA